MVELIFGILWILITGFCTWGFYGTGGDVYVNDTLVSHEEFVEMLAPKLFIGLFWISGIIFIAVGVVKCIKKISKLSYMNKELEKNNFEEDNYNKKENKLEDDPIKNL